MTRGRDEDKANREMMCVTYPTRRTVCYSEMQTERRAEQLARLHPLSRRSTRTNNIYPSTEIRDRYLVAGERFDRTAEEKVGSMELSTREVIRRKVLDVLIASGSNPYDLDRAVDWRTLSWPHLLVW